MSVSVRFHPEISNDLADSIAWYEEVSPELAHRFLNSVRDASALKTRPLLPRNVAEIGPNPLKRSPYLRLRGGLSSVN